MRTVVCVAVLCVMVIGCGADEPDFSNLVSGPRQVKFTDYTDSMVFGSATRLVTGAVLKFYDAPPFDEVVVHVGTRDVGDYRDGYVEVADGEPCAKFTSYAHNFGHVIRQLVEGSADPGHHDERFFAADDSVERSVTDLLCEDPRYAPKD